MIHFLTIARVLYDKGFRELIECAEYYKNHSSDVEFSWLGGIDSGYSQYVSEEEVMQYHNRGIINYLGFKNDVREYIKRADCIILPSYHEGMSRVLMESLAMRKPIITTDIPGCKETVIEGSNGFLCLPKDSASLIKAVCKFLSLSESERKNMGVRSREYAKERFDIRNVMRIYDDVIENIVKNPMKIR